MHEALSLSLLCKNVRYKCLINLDHINNNRTCYRLQFHLLHPLIKLVTHFGHICRRSQSNLLQIMTTFVINYDYIR